jgi:hypothetical protein
LIERGEARDFLFWGGASLVRAPFWTSRPMGELAFDTLQRFAAIRSLVADVELQFQEPGPEGYHLLDVGGYPGALADFLAPGVATLTLDRPECDRPDYKRGTGAELPFESGAFPMALASDTLEHIPPDERRRFLSELARVSSRFVLAAGPLRSALANRAEAGLSELYERCHGESHRWLSEHRALGLPGADLIADAWAPLGSLTIRTNGCLPNWTLMMGLSFLDEHFAAAPPGSENPGSRLSRQYVRLREKHGSDDSEPAYRCLVLLDKRGEPQALDKALASFPAAARGEPETPSERFALELLLEHLQGLAERFAPRAEMSPAAIERGYAEQLEKALRLAEQSTEALSSGSEKAKRLGWLRRLKRRLFPRRRGG